MQSAEGLVTPESIERARELNREYEARGYTWRAHGDEVVITVPLPEIVKKHDVEVECEKQSLRVALLGNVVCEGTLFQEVEKDEMTYTLSSGVLEILLTMKKQMTWLQLFR